ncbi:MAG TPA: ABC transporter ATP-binding protein [Peptococcaceae bacterium]|nr:ABC transporter ATP-binding protein [Peptococcaceae bacterium]
MLNPGEVCKNKNQVTDKYQDYVFELCKVFYKYKEKIVLRDISLQIPKGQITGIIGPNGSGKTTLLKVLSGANKPCAGQVLLNKRPLQDYSRQEIARQIAFLEQNNNGSLPFTVREVVEMGRYPWLKPLAPLTLKDKEVIASALECFDLTAKQDRVVETLSGGERQLVSLARAMAQEPKILILDEPTTYLDIGHQSMVMEYLRKWHKESATTIIMVIHDLNLSSQYCDHLIVLNDGRFIQAGNKDEVLCEELIAKTYKASFSMIRHPVSGVPQFLPCFSE